MKRAMIVPLFLVCYSSCFAQKDSLQVQEDDHVIFEPVEIEARWLGGVNAWKKFIAENLRYPKKAKKQFLPGTVHTIKATFIVNIDSSITNIEITDDPGYGFGKEIRRLILSGGKWKPAMQNGRVVKAYKRELFVFRRPDQ